MKKCFRCFNEYCVDYEVCPYCGYIDGTAVEEPRYLQPGTQLQNRYIVGTVVGAGGFGITYSAWDTILNQKVAIKEYLPGEFSTRSTGQTQVTIYGGEKTEQFKEGKEKFHEESIRLAKFQNIPGIVQIYSSFKENETVYIVMEYLEGETLESKLKREGKISEQETVEIILPILQALDVVHKEGILHRDIAPNNIFLTSEGEVKLLDFGAARSATGSHSKSLTVLYKEGYTPEEQYRSRGDQGPWTDVYACAATMYRMLTGKLPPGALERRRKDTLKEPSKNGAKVCRGTDIAIMNALNVEIKHRTPNTEKFIKELTGGNAKSHFVRTEEKKMGRIPLWIKAIAIVAVGLMGVFLLLIAAGLYNGGMEAFENVEVPEGKTRVPNLVNTNIQTAQETTESSELVFMITQKQFSLEIPENKILSQEVDAGSITDMGTQVNVIVSAGVNSMTVQEMEENGIEMVEIPDLQYQDRDEAMGMLLDAGLIVNIEYEKTGIVEGGKVTKQSVNVGEKLVKGQEITLTIEDFGVDWTDAEIFEEMIRNQINKPYGTVYASELLSIEELGYLQKDSYVLGEDYNAEPLSNCLNLKTLTILLGFSDITDADFQNNSGYLRYMENLENLTKLEKVEIGNINLENISWIKNMQNLTSLYCFNAIIDNFDVEKELINLKKIDLPYSSIETINNRKIFSSVNSLLITGEMIEKIGGLNEFNNLTVLEIVEYGDPKFENIAKLSNIKELNITLNHILGRVDFKFLENLNQLESLTLNYKFVTSVKNVEILENMVNLKYLKVGSNVAKKVDVLSEILVNAKKLGQLEMIEIIEMQ